MEEQDSPNREDLGPLFLKARDAAFRLLSYRARSQSEMRRRLLQRYPPSVVEPVLAFLRQHRFLDDQTFAQQWRKDREEHRPRARQMVRLELLRRGVSSEIVQETLEDFDDAANAYEAGLKLAQRLMSRGGSEEEFWRRLWSHLQRRGFRYGQVKDTTDQLWRELGADSLHGQGHAEDDK